MDADEVSTWVAVAPVTDLAPASARVVRAAEVGAHVEAGQAAKAESARARFRRPVALSRSHEH